MLFLAADIGGFRSRLLIGDAAGEAWRVLRLETFASAAHAGVDVLPPRCAAEVADRPARAGD